MSNGMVWKIALAISLALNLFVGGIVVGAIGQRHRVMEMRRGPMPGAPLMRIGQGLPEDKQQAFRLRMRQAGEANRVQGESLRAARAKVAEVFSAPTFDPAAANQALAAVRDADAALRANMEGAVVDFAKTLGPEERKALAVGLNRPPGRGGRGAHRDGGRRGFDSPPGGPDGRGPGADDPPPPPPPQ